MLEVERLRQDFDIEQLVMVGDRGMISQKAIDTLSGRQGVHWITALKSASIRSLMNQGQIQMDLFDERNLFELTHPDYPNERLVACRNPALAELRAHKREDLLQATERELEKIVAAVTTGRLKGQDNIGVRVSRVISATRWPNTSSSTSTMAPSPSIASATASFWKPASTGFT